MQGNENRRQENRPMLEMTPLPSASVDQIAPPQGPKVQLNDLIAETANLMAVNEQLRKEIAENEHIHSLQMRALSNLPQRNQNASLPNVDARRRGERRMQKPESYKTVICQAWLESKTCTFAENCRFAHGEEELRPSRIEPYQNNKYQTKLCDKYTTTGLCPYGKRCLFIHPDHGPNAYIRADKLFEVSQRHAMADLRDQMEQHIMNGGRTAAPGLSSVPNPLDMLARPSTPEEPAMKLPLGPTPVSTRGPRYDLSSRNTIETEDAENLPPSSWPLGLSSFFSLDNPNMASRPVSPFESMLIGAAANGMLPFTMLGKQSTPGGVSGYSSAGSTPYQDIDSSPLTAASAAAAAAYIANSSAAQTLLLKSAAVDPMLMPQRDESFSQMAGFDQLAEEMAKHLELW